MIKRAFGAIPWAFATHASDSFCLWAEEHPTFFHVVKESRTAHWAVASSFVINITFGIG
jgi:hypothetical protein